MLGVVQIWCQIDVLQQAFTLLRNEHCPRSSLMRDNSNSNVTQLVEDRVGETHRLVLRQSYHGVSVLSNTAHQINFHAAARGWV